MFEEMLSHGFIRVAGVLPVRKADWRNIGTVMFGAASAD